MRTASPSSASAAAHELRQRLRHTSSGSPELASSGPFLAPGSAGSGGSNGSGSSHHRSAAKNRAAGARLTPLPVQPRPPPHPTRSRSRDPAGAEAPRRGRHLPQRSTTSTQRTPGTPSTSTEAAATSAAARGALPPGRSQRAGSTEPSRSASRDFASTAGGKPVNREPSRDFSNSTGGVRKPRKPGLPVGRPTPSTACSNRGAHVGGPSPAGSTGSLTAAVASVSTRPTAGATLPTRPSIRRTGNPTTAAATHAVPNPQGPQASHSTHTTAGVWSETPTDTSTTHMSASAAKTGVPLPHAASSDEGRRSVHPKTAAPQERREKAPTGTKKALPRSPHDMDQGYYKNPANWNPALTSATTVATSGASALTWEKIRYLLQGKALEPAFASHLWAQCAEDPAAAMAAHGVPSTAMAGGGGAAAVGDGDEAPLHSYSGKLLDGFFSCVRCRTPVCSPSYFLQPRHTPSQQPGPSPLDSGDDEESDDSVSEVFQRSRSHRTPQMWSSFPEGRGYACFTHVHAGALRVELAMEATLGAKSEPHRRHPSAGANSNPFLRHDAAHAREGSDDGLFRRSPAYAGARDGASGPTAFVFCVNCDGCLGAITLQESAGLADRPGRPARHPQTEIFLANSMCLAYVATESTRAPLGGHVLLDNSESDGDEASVVREAARTSLLRKEGGWVSEGAGASTSRAHEHRTLPPNLEKGRRRFVFQPGAVGEGDELEARVVQVTQPMGAKPDGDTEDSEEGQSPLSRRHHVPLSQFKPTSYCLPSAHLATSVDADDALSMEDVSTMFDDLDNAALYA